MLLRKIWYNLMLHILRQRISSCSSRKPSQMFPSMKSTWLGNDGQEALSQQCNTSLWQIFNVNVFMNNVDRVLTWDIDYRSLIPSSNDPVDFKKSCTPFGCIKLKKKTSVNNGTTWDRPWTTLKAGELTPDFFLGLEVRSIYTSSFRAGGPSQWASWSLPVGSGLHDIWENMEESPSILQFRFFFWEGKHIFCW